MVSCPFFNNHSTLVFLSDSTLSSIRLLLAREDDQPNSLSSSQTNITPASFILSGLELEQQHLNLIEAILIAGLPLPFQGLQIGRLNSILCPPASPKEGHFGSSTCQAFPLSVKLTLTFQKSKRVPIPC